MEDRSCPACDASRSDYRFTRDGFAHVRCRRCGTLFVSPLPSEATIRAVYDDPAYRADQGASEERARHDARARAEVLAGRGVKSVLEIGCGNGEFLDATTSLGMHAEGIDAGPVADRLAARGLKVHRVWLDAFDPPRRYDAVALWEVIEHLGDPHASLEAVREWLVPAGVLALSTPSVSGVPARVLGQRFPMISPPEHLELYSRRGLGLLLERAGFRPFRFTSFSNLDAETLARGFGRYFLGSSRVGRLCAQVAGRVAEVPARLFDRAGLGTSFEVYAERVR